MNTEVISSSLSDITSQSIGVCWEAHLPDVICADYHGYTLREIKLLIDEDSKKEE